MVLTLAGIFGLQQASYASAPSPRTITIPVGGAPVGTGGLLTSDWQVGDCWMLQGSYVDISDDWLHIHATTSTDHTNHADIWHSTIIYRDVHGKALAGGSGSLLDSPPMTPREGSSGPSDVITWDRWMQLKNVPPTLPFDAWSIDWTGSC